MRINKYVATCGICSRRAADELVKQGKISVNGKVMRELSYEVDTRRDRVTYLGDKISPPKTNRYYIMHKPKGYVCTTKDEKGRRTVFDLLTEEENSRRLFTVGRLDYDTEGLLIITDDGDLAQNLTHPSREIGKTYVVKTDTVIEESSLAALRNGLKLPDGHDTGKSQVRVLPKDESAPFKLEVTIYEGHNRQVKQMMEAVGAKVLFLKRTKIGELRLGGLSRGKSRQLTKSEIAYLKSM